MMIKPLRTSRPLQIGDTVTDDRYLAINRVTKKTTGKPAEFVVVGFKADGSPKLWPDPKTSDHCIERSR